MKKFKLLAAALFVCTAAFTGYKAYDNATMTAQQQLLLQNVEALAQDEASNKKKCHDTVTTSESQQTRYCGTCTFISGKPSTWSSEKEC